jgi:hypothetical protein
MKRLFLLIFSIGIGFANRADAAACCGGGLALPALIVGDDRAQVTTSYAYSQVIDDVAADATWQTRDSVETSETFKLEAAHIFWDRWQAGFAIPIVRRTRGGYASSGPGDVAATVGYEYLPDWDYNPWRPRGLGFLQLTAPTGRSVYETDGPYQLDSRGRGFWTLSAGTLLSKVVGKYDLFTTIEGHRSFERSYQHTHLQETLHPGYGTDLGIGGGYNLAKLRFGGSITWSYEDPVDVTGTESSNGYAQQFATAALTAGYLFDDWIASASYMDQTLFGQPLNTTLGRGATVILQRHWFR